jgi:hypothetical protein
VFCEIPFVPIAGRSCQQMSHGSDRPNTHMRAHCSRYVGPRDSPEANAGVNSWIATFAVTRVSAVADARAFESQAQPFKARWREQERRIRANSAATYCSTGSQAPRSWQPRAHARCWAGPSCPPTKQSGVSWRARPPPDHAASQRNRHPRPEGASLTMIRSVDLTSAHSDRLRGPV